VAAGTAAVFVVGLQFRILGNPQGQFPSGRRHGRFRPLSFCGPGAFGALQDGLQRASGSLSENRDLLLKTQIPSVIFPAVAAAGTLVQEVTGLSILIAAAWIMGYVPGITLVLLPLLIV
jgi:ABC-type polysaccharide/polyol phosphate export permease